MKKFLGKTWAKVAAFLLACLTIPLTLGCFVGMAVAYSDGLYYQPPDSIEDSDFAWGVVYRSMSGLDEYITLGNDYRDYEPDPAFSYVLYDADGRVMQDTRTEDSVLVIEGRNFSYNLEYYGYSSWEELDVDFDSLPKSADFYINLPISAESRWHSAYTLYNNLIVNMKDNYFFIGLASLVLSAVLFVFLMFASGRSEESEEIVLRGLNRVPFDLYTAILVFLGGAIILAVSELGYYYNYNYDDALLIMAGLGLGSIGVTVLALALCMTAAARFKTRGWWKNTVIYRLYILIKRVCCFIWRTLKNTASALPIVWKTVLIYCGFTLINLLLFIIGIDNGAAFFIVVLFILDLLALAVLIAASMQCRELMRAGHAIAKGDMSVTVDTSKMYGDIKQHGEDLNNISLGVSRAVEERMKSERFKTELITNVSHDLKTPLTSIVNYVDLLKKENIENEAAREYLEVLDRQSEKLRKLTVDLVDASKASAGVINVNREKLELKELVDQCSGEYAEKLSAAGVDLICTVPENSTVIIADGRLLWRVLDNLMQNVIKYSLSGTRAYLTLEQKDKRAVLSVKNISREPLNIPASELLERFVRGDSSRSSEGSGLGLSIALSLTELMGGTLELFLDGDLFKAVIEFDMV